MPHLIHIYCAHTYTQARTYMMYICWLIETNQSPKEHYMAKTAWHGISYDLNRFSIDVIIFILFYSCSFVVVFLSIFLHLLLLSASFFPYMLLLLLYYVVQVSGFVLLCSYNTIKIASRLRLSHQVSLYIQS